MLRPLDAPGGGVPRIADQPSAPDVAVFASTLDELLALERTGGGWAFPPGPDGRPHPYTFLMQSAEWLAGGLDLARWDLLVMRSPGTPAAGLLLLDGHRLTGEARYLDGARRAGELLLAAQLPSGGWVSEMPVEGGRLAGWFPLLALHTTLDDDVTTGAVRFLLALWERTGDDRFRGGAEGAIDLLLRAQHRSGAWPHAWRPPWLRTPWTRREDRPSLNDGLTPIIVETLLAAAEPLDRPDLVEAARQGGEWLLAVQQLPPGAGWAQQYDAAGRPIGMRRFELSALASWESRHAVDALDALARTTGDARWCTAARAAAGWLARAAITPGCWARFYDLADGRPLYVDAAGARVAAAAAARPGYDWQGDFGIGALLHRLGLAPGAAPPAPLPGDPGACPGMPDPLHAHGSVRSLIARAGMLRARLEPPPVSPCVAERARACLSPRRVFARVAPR